MKTNSALPAVLRASLLLVFVLSVALCRAADGNPPDRMTYQGYLTDANGDPLGNTNTGPKNYDVIFRVYTDLTTGTKLWAEQQTVTVDRGYFSVLLGEGASYSTDPRPPLNTLFTNTANASDRYIEVTVQGIGPSGTPVTIAPRLRLLTSPYAFLARTAVTANSLANNASAQVVSINGTNVGINKPSPSSALDVNGAVTATALTVNGPAALNSTVTMATGAGISSASVLEFGRGVAGKELNAGKIGYQAFSPDALDIIGAGTTGANRKVKIYAESGLTVTGPIAVTGNASATAFVGNGTIPVGGIIMWSGATVPAGWHLCDGTTGTPDLRNRFIVGSGSSYALGAAGGAASHTNTVAEMPSHQHTIYEGSSKTGENAVGGAIYSMLPQTASSSTTVLTAATGSATPYSTLPPYYALAFIMRVQ